MDPHCGDQNEGDRNMGVSTLPVKAKGDNTIGVRTSGDRISGLKIPGDRTKAEMNGSTVTYSLI